MVSMARTVWWVFHFQVFDVLLDADSQSEVPRCLGVSNLIRLWKPVKGCHKGADNPHF